MSRYWLPLSLFALAFLILPHDVFAALGDFTDPIIPKDIQTCAAGWKGLLVVFNNLIKFALSFAILVAVVTIAYGGFLLVLSPANPENRSKAKNLLINAAIGMAIALGAWLIVNTVIGALSGGQKDIGAFTGFLGGGTEWCYTPEGAVIQPRGGGGQLVGSNNTPIVGSEKEVRASLKNAGIDVNKAPCPPGVPYQNVSGGCTTVAGLREATVQQVINVNNICGSALVTGGNELGHSAGHTNGDKVDLSTGVSSCITGGAGGYFKRSGDRSGDPRYEDKCGNEYVLESNPAHWDIKVATACSK